jgi:hypothetical protein
LFRSSCRHCAWLHGQDDHVLIRARKPFDGRCAGRRNDPFAA